MPSNTNINLGLPALPDTQNPELFAALVPIYNALQLLSSGVDVLTGTQYIPSSDYSAMSDANSLIAGNQFKIFRKFGEQVLAGRMVRLADASGISTAYLATDGTIVGFSPKTVAAGEYGVIILCGLYQSSGLTTGTLYGGSASPGLINASGTQKVIRALSSTAGFFLPGIA